MMKMMKICDVCEIRHGANQCEVESPDGKYPIYGSGGAFGFATKYRCPEKTVLIGRKGTLNNPIFVKTPCWNIDTAYGLIANECILPEYLYYFCLVTDFTTLDPTSGRPSTKSTSIAKIPIPIPGGTAEESRNEQLRIVGILNAAFEKIDAIKRNAEQNLQNAKVLFQQALNDAMTPKEGWISSNFGAIGEVCMCKRIMKNETTSCGDVPFFKIGTLGKNPDAFIARPLFEKYKERYRYPTAGTILLSAAGTIGYSVVFDGKNAYFQDSNIVWIDNDEKQVKNCFLQRLYQVAKWDVEDGTTIKRLYNSNLKATKCFYPSDIKEQEAIVNKLNLLSRHKEELQQNYSQTISACDELKKSILSKAFAGEL